MSLAGRREYTVELIATGNELIYGRLVDTNSSWLAKRIWEEGGSVTRITLVGDEKASVQDTLLSSMKRLPSMIVVTGGLGPTFDDITTQAVSQALRRNCILDETSLQALKRKYEAWAEKKGVPLELTPQRKKMAYIVEGSKPIPNHVGLAVGMKIDMNSTIIILPGVPKEMKVMFNKHVVPIIRTNSRIMSRARKVRVRMESYGVLGTILEDITTRHRGAFLKAYADDVDDIKGIRVDILARRESLRSCISFLDFIVKELTNKIESVGGRLSSYE